MSIVISFIIGSFVGALTYALISNGMIKKIVNDVKGKV